MTSYHVVAPILLGRFQGSDGVFFRAWSPRRYGPSYTYDITIESEDNQHPAMNVEYTDLLRRVLHQQQGVEESPLVDLTTDFHCPTPVEERGEEAFVITFRDGPFSPVFFVREDAILYLEYVREELGQAIAGHATVGQAVAAGRHATVGQAVATRGQALVLRSFPHERI